MAGISSSGWAEGLEQTISRDAFLPQPFCDTVYSSTAFLLCPRLPGTVGSLGTFCVAVINTIKNHPKPSARWKWQEEKRQWEREREMPRIHWFYSWNPQYNINPKYPYILKFYWTTLSITGACAQHPDLKVWILLCYFKQGFLAFWRLCYHADKTNSLFSNEEIPLVAPFLLRERLNEKTQE